MRTQGIGVVKAHGMALLGAQGVGLALLVQAHNARCKQGSKECRRCVSQQCNRHLCRWRWAHEDTGSGVREGLGFQGAGKPGKQGSRGSKECHLCISQKCNCHLCSGR